MRSATWSVLLFAGVSLAGAPSPDGTCGGEKGYTCWASWFGNCCGADGKCGTSPEQCATGCQKDFGFCSSGTYDFTPRQAPSLEGYGGYGEEEEDDDESCGCDDDDETSSSVPYYASSTPSPSSSGVSPSYSANSTVPYPTGSGSVSKSIPYPTGSGSISIPVGPTIPVSSGTAPYPSSGSSSKPYPSGSVSKSVPYPTGSGSVSKSIPYPTGSGSVSKSIPYPTGSGSVSKSIPYPTGSGSISIPVGPTVPVSSGTAPYSSGGSSSKPYPSGSGSVPYSSGSVPPYSSGTAPYSSGSIPLSSGTAPSSSRSIPLSTGTAPFSSVPLSTGTAPVSSKPLSTGTSPVSSKPASSGTIGTSSTSSSSTCSSTPVPTSWLPNCTPCSGKGQSNTGEWCGLTVNDDSYQNTPVTCRVVTYEFEITDDTLSPDGIARPVMLVNGQLPGPLLEANWGDTVVVKLTNNLQSKNGTSIHFHGIRQSNNSENDGVPSITQCPVAPGETFTYVWVAENYGSSWYHSHYALQAWEGVFGPMIIHGPHSSDDFDEDKGMIILQDWSHFTVDSRYDLAQNATVNPKTNATFGGPVVMDNGLINGLNVWGDDGAVDQVGSRWETTFEPGKKYLLRLVNTAIQSTYKFYIDEHEFTVISADFVPIVPYKTNIININIGQRYNVIVEAKTNPTGPYWMRSDNQNACAGTIQALNIKAIVHYSNINTTALPTSTAYNYTTECIDEPEASLVPVVALNAGSADQIANNGSMQIVVAGNQVSLFKWFIGGTTFFSEYSDPTLLDIQQDNTTPDYSGNLLINTPGKNEMVYVIVETPIPLPHPVHLHGHDFWVLAQGPGSYSSNVTLNLQNPPRRDTALMPGAGYLVIAFVTDNPGVWLMHCHIGWHTSMGWALQVVERIDEIPQGIDDSCKLKGNCKTWSQWASANDVVVVDSGV